MGQQIQEPAPFCRSVEHRGQALIATLKTELKRNARQSVETELGEDRFGRATYCVSIRQIRSVSICARA